MITSLQHPKSGFIPYCVDGDVDTADEGATLAVLEPRRTRPTGARRLRIARNTDGQRRIAHVPLTSSHPTKAVMPLV